MTQGGAEIALRQAQGIYNNRKNIMKLIEWVKTHKLSLLLIVIILFMLSKSFVGIGVDQFASRSMSSTSLNKSLLAAPEPAGVGGSEITVQDNFTPNVATNRKVIENSYMSLLVKDVTDVRKKIINFAQTNGGYMVNSEISNPQDAPQATVIVRIPSKNLETILDSFRKLAVKVVTESLQGTDVTDQFTDIEKNIALYEKSKAKFEDLLARAQEISDITNLTQQIINYQSQIDSLKGQSDYLAKSAELAKITIYLSTDEIALPYAPNETFRPSVIFKLAVRSLVSNLRSLATALIWIVVYGVVVVPLFFIVRFAYRKLFKKSV